MAMDNVFTKLLLRVLVAGYIIFMSVKLLTSSDTGGNQTIFTIIAIFFIFASGAFIVYAILDYFKKKDSNDSDN